MSKSGPDQISISTGVVAQDVVKENTFSVFMAGSAAASQFKTERIVSSQTDFFASIKSVKLAIFATGTGKTSLSKVGQSAMKLHARNDIFKCLFIMGKSR